MNRRSCESRPPWRLGHESGQASVAPSGKSTRARSPRGDQLIAARLQIAPQRVAKVHYLRLMDERVADLPTPAMSSRGHGRPIFSLSFALALVPVAAFVVGACATSRTKPVANPNAPTATPEVVAVEPRAAACLFT